MIVSARHCGLVAAAIATAALFAALYFQHVLGYQPCQMCLWQRWAYYIGVPLLLIAAFTGSRGLLLIAAIIFAANATLGLYHSGVEWDLWQGPATCGAGADLSGSGDLMADLQSVRVVPCDEAPWRFVGLSFAGWSMIVCTVVAAISFAGARR